MRIVVINEPRHGHGSTVLQICNYDIGSYGFGMPSMLRCGGVRVAMKDVGVSYFTSQVSPARSMSRRQV